MTEPMTTMGPVEEVAPVEITRRWRWRRARSGSGSVGTWRVYRPFFTGQARRLVVLAASSFVAGLCEAALLVIVARLAFSIGGSDEIPGGLGPLDSFDPTVNQMFLGALLLTSVRLLLQVVAARTSARLTSELTFRIRKETFADYVRASWAVQAAEEEAAVQDLLVRHTGRVSSAVGIMATGLSVGLALLALVASAIVVDPVSALLIIGSGAFLFVLLRPLTERAKQVSAMQMQAGRNYAGRSMEAVALSLEIRSFGVSDEVAGRLEEATAAEAEPIYRSQLFKGLLTALYQLVAVLILITGLYATHTFLDRSLASLGAIVVILVRALNQSGTLQGAYHSMVEIVPFAERLLSERARFRASSPPSGERPLDPPRSLRFADVSYRYVADRVALADISFEVAGGEAVGIIGPSGSGKSTLIQLLLRLRHPDSGCYLVDGIDANAIQDESWFSQVAFVPQECRVFNTTIRENIAFYRPDATPDDITEAARRAHIDTEIRAMPQGYDTVLGSRGGALSGGQRQRISIARALVRRPSILVLDEPTSALDMHSESLVHETFNALKGSVTMFVIAHRLSTLNTCDRIMVMGDGRLQAFGLRSELDRSSPFYREALSLSRIRS